MAESCSCGRGPEDPIAYQCIDCIRERGEVSPAFIAFRAAQGVEALEKFISKHPASRGELLGAITYLRTTYADAVARGRVQESTR